MKKLGDLISPNDPELVQKTLSRLDEQDRWNDVFSTKLIELLDKHDAMRLNYRQMLLHATSELQAAKSNSSEAKQLLDSATVRCNDAAGVFLEASQTSEEAKELLNSAISQHKNGEKRLLELADKLASSSRKLELAEALMIDQIRKEKQMLVIAILVFIIAPLWLVGIVHPSVLSRVLATIITIVIGAVATRKVQ
jgi:hypothetical protein